MSRPTGRWRRRAEEAAWIEQAALETGWPHATVAYADMTVEDARPALDRLARFPRVRGIRQQFHWHENPLYRFASRPDLCADPAVQRNVARLADYGFSFDLQVFAGQMEGAAGLAAACPRVTFVLQHAGMLEDLSAPGREAWREGMAVLAACPNVVAKLSGFGTFIHRNDAGHVAWIARETLAMFGPGRCLFGSNFPIEKLWTGYAPLLDAHLRATEGLDRAARNAVFFDNACRVYRLSGEDGGMALEIKLLDYGDIELESSFLVLARDCGRTAAGAGLRLPDPRRALAHRGGHRLPRQRDHGDARHARPPVPREHDRAPARPPRREARRRALRLHTHLHIDHAGKDDHFPMNTTVVVNRREMECSVSGLMHPQYPKPDVHAPRRAAAHAATRCASRISSCPARSRSSPASCWKRRTPTPRAR